MRIGQSDSELRKLVEQQARQLNEAAQQQAATAEVLRVISQSATNLDHVLTTVLQKAADLCAAGPAQIFRRDGEVFRYAVSRILNPVYRKIEQQVRIRPGRETLVGRVALEGQAVHIDDAWADPEYGPQGDVRIGNVRSMLGVPLLKGSDLIGVMVLGRSEVLPFSPAEIVLVTTFADQAVIAIENARLFEEARARTEELEGSLERLRQTQDRLVQTEKLAALGQLVAGVAHEINTPVGNAITVTSIVERELRRLRERTAQTGVDPADLTRALHRLRDGTAMVSANLDRAASLIQNFSRIASVQLSGGRRRFSAKTLLDKALQALPPQRHSLVVECQEGLDIDGYPDLLAQVIEGLIRNAGTHAYAEDETGTIAIRARLTEEGDVAIRVEDDGCGIAPQHLNRVFEPFFTTGRGKGALGLGLHIAHGAVAAMMGEIAVESTVGTGTSFTVVFPQYNP
ncbi:sensor histidine kinase [Enterovirga rhinocerotis]|nr:sensor histidine kinase [Enterovirga rhinocerotis]